MITTGPAGYQVGEVIEDSYGNPAVVFRVDRGVPVEICQTSDADRGRLSAPPLRLVRVTDAAAVEQAKAIGREVWRQLATGSKPAAAPAAAPAAPAAPAAFAKPAGTHPPTDEQKAIIDAYLRGECLVINAFAGSGKTTILKMLANADPRKKIIYLAYNAAAKKDARKAFPRNARCMTTHGLAFQPMIHMAQRVGAASKYLPGRELAKLMRILGPQRLSAGKILAPGQLASVVKATIGRFCYTADEKITGWHVPNDKQRWAPDEIEALRQIVPPIAQRLWDEDITTADGQMPMDHDYYLKAFALTHPRLDAGAIFLDEAQDSNACVSALVLEQIRYGTQVAMTGDTYQQIYEWRGATNAMKTFAEQPGVTVLSLTQSFRFGPSIAAWANKALQILGSPNELRGFDKMRSRVGNIAAHPDAVLCRTNAEALKQAIYYLGLGLKVAFPRGAGEITGLVRAAKDLKEGRPVEHLDLMAFATYGQLQDYVATEPDGEDLKQLVDMIDEHGVDELLVILGQIGNEDKDFKANITIGTTHGAKGREWRTALIAGDFREPKRDPENPGAAPKIPAEQARLIYVALTRGMYVLDPSGVEWIDKYLPAAAAGEVA